MGDAAPDGDRLRLPPRLAAIAAHVPAGARLADIGTDHALLPVALARAERILSAVAIDVRPGALAQARRTVALHRAAACVAVRPGDGLSPLRPGEADVVVISGLGGPAIVRILSADPAIVATVRRLVLAPQSATWRVRRWLMTHGFGIVAEDLARDDGRSYEIVVAARGDPRAAYRWPGRPAAHTMSVLALLGPVLARAAGADWQARWRAAADDWDARAALAATGRTRAAAATAARLARRAARIRRAVDAAAAARDPAADGPPVVS